MLLKQLLKSLSGLFVHNSDLLKMRNELSAVMAQAAIVPEGAAHAVTVGSGSKKSGHRRLQFSQRDRDVGCPLDFLSRGGGLNREASPLWGGVLASFRCTVTTAGHHARHHPVSRQRPCCQQVLSNARESWGCPLDFSSRGGGLNREFSPLWDRVLASFRCTVTTAGHHARHHPDLNDDCASAGAE